jgi:hypothetical protein
MATMIAELVCVIRYKGEPNADYLLYVYDWVHRGMGARYSHFCVPGAGGRQPDRITGDRRSHQTPVAVGG